MRKKTVEAFNLIFQELSKFANTSNFFVLGKSIRLFLSIFPKNRPFKSGARTLHFKILASLQNLNKILSCLQLQ